MADRPILFNAEMVRAILDGRKTQTRRVLKPQREPVEGAYFDSGQAVRLYPHGDCPYGHPGDRLWVRETWALAAHAPDEAREADWCWYRASGDGVGNLKADRWRPSIFMPRWASRITLDVTDVRVERVQDITEDGARWEGVGRVLADEVAGLGEAMTLAGRVGGFEVLWDSINAKRGFGWATNPWVWVVSFKRSEVADG